MICPNQSNRGPLNMKKRKKKELKCGSLPTADIVGAVGKTTLHCIFWGGILKLSFLGRRSPHFILRCLYLDRVYVEFVFVFLIFDIEESTYGWFHLATAKICWYWWKSQYCNPCHFSSSNKNFMKIFVLIIWLCKHSEMEFESRKQFCKYDKNWPKIR